MSDALFELEPAALIYANPAPPMHKMKCRECHKRGAPIGGGWMNGHAYMICTTCAEDRGELGARSRRGGWSGRELVVIESEGR